MDKEISSRSPLRYPGGKFRARVILEKELPVNIKQVFAPFIGGGSFELYLANKNYTVHGLDKFELLANFWEQLLSNPETLAEKVNLFHSKTVDSVMFRTLQQELKQIEKIPENANLLDLATKFFVINRCSFSGSTLSGGFSKESAKSRFTESSIQKLKNFHNPNIFVQTGDVFTTPIPTGTELLFLDPPYLLEGKEKNKLYGISGSMHNTFDHYAFHELIKNVDIPFLLTYNNSEEVSKLWKNYNISSAEWSYGMNKSKTSSEIIVKNY
jgi:DNA adenine methylase